MNLEALQREAGELAANHPSKDCRFFAAQIPELISLVREMAEALEWWSGDRRKEYPEAMDALIKYKEACK
jgi:hypothetical protein